jgi:formamidopyrimidine-DNA glycosylase
LLSFSTPSLNKLDPEEIFVFMPELPEVETIIRRLRDGTQDQPSVCLQTIQSVEVTWERIIATPSPAAFQQSLIGKTIIDARRRGKFLHFPLNSGHLIGHLRMSGDMRMEQRVLQSGEPCPAEPYDRVILNFDTPYRLVFSNIRKFGRMWYVDDPQSVFTSLGPEPLDPGFHSRQLYEMLQKHNRQVKPLLMDQAFIAGLGNIYTDESLFRARIHPLRKSDTLTMDEAIRLHQAIGQVLQEGIHRFGASVDWIYRGGEFQNDFNVYGRVGESCPVCGRAIEKILVGQRGTHFCPVCQK